MKKLFTILLGLFAISTVNAQFTVGEKTNLDMTAVKHSHASANKTMAVDTLWTYVNRASSAVFYSYAYEGYVFGPAWDTTSTSGSLVTYKVTDETAMHFDAFGTPIQITEILGWVAKIRVLGGSSDTVYGRIYDAGSDSMPTTQIGFGKLAISNMDSSFSFTLTSIPMTTYNGQGITNGAFLVSWDYSNITNDTFGLVSSNPDSGDGMNEKRARQRLGPDIGGTWARVHTGIYNSLNADVFLLPVINDAPVVGLEAPKFKGLTVLGNYPNPANSESNIRFSLDDEKVVSLKVFDTHGRNIADINQSFSAGDHLFTIDMTPYAAGNYYYTLKVEGQSFTAKINVIK